MIPAKVLAQIPQVYEILIAMHEPLADNLWTALIARSHRAGIKVVLIQEVFEVNYVWQMREAGFTIYEARLPEDDLIFLDRDQGYRLPNWEPLQDPFSLACKLAWSRTGGYSCIRDTVTEFTDSRTLMKVEAHHHLWFSVRHVARLPQVGERVTMLTYHPFTDIGDLCDVIAILPEPENR